MVTTPAALKNTYGLAVKVGNNGPLYAEDYSPDAEDTYRVRFLFDPNSVSITSDRHVIFRAFGSTGQDMLKVELGKRPQRLPHLGADPEG